MQSQFSIKRFPKQGCMTVGASDFLAVVYQHGAGWSVRVGYKGESDFIPCRQFSMSHSFPSRRAAIRYGQVVITEKMEVAE